MPRGALLPEGTRPGERTSGAAGSSPRAFLASFRRWAWASSVLGVWGLASLLQWALGAALRPEALTLLLAGPAVAAAALLLLSEDRAKPHGRRFHAACALVAVALAAAVAGHVLHPRGASLAPWVAPEVGETLGLNGAAGLAAALLSVTLVPLLAGWRVHALDLALATTGRRPRGLPLRALSAASERDLLVPPPPARLALGLLRRWARGAALPGLLALDAGAWLLARGRDLARGQRTERVHAAADLDALADAVAREEGWRAETQGERVVATLAREDAPPLVVSFRRAHLAFPLTGAAMALDLSGPREAVAEARRLLDGPLAAAVVFSWSAQGRRWEARLNALLAAAREASTLEERSLLYEEAQRVERILERRDLMPEEWSVLRAWKAQRLRAHLAHVLLSEPVGARRDRGVVAPAPALLPCLPLVMDAGGLATLRRLLFVPFWVLPVRSRWGEHEVLVHAGTGAPALDLSGPLLAAARRDGARLLLDLPGGATFLPAPEPTAAVLRALRDALPLAVDVAPAAESPAERLLVPFLPRGDAYVNAVTGAPAPDLGPVRATPARAQAP